MGTDFFSNLILDHNPTRNLKNLQYLCKHEQSNIGLRVELMLERRGTMCDAVLKMQYCCVESTMSIY